MPIGGDSSPINNNAIPNIDDDLDFEKEILDATSQSFLNQSMAGPNNQQETSRIMNES